MFEVTVVKGQRGASSSCTGFGTADFLFYIHSVSQVSHVHCFPPLCPSDTGLAASDPRSRKTASAESYCPAQHLWVTRCIRRESNSGNWRDANVASIRSSYDIERIQVRKRFVALHDVGEGGTESEDISLSVRVVGVGSRHE